jgi:hypothetical protein
MIGGIDFRVLSPRARVGFGLLCIGLGLFPMLAAFDVGPLRRADINGPPWLGFVAGGLFVMAGFALLAGERLRDPRLAFVFVFVILAGFAAIGNWIAFGAGTRTCGVSATGFLLTTSRGAGDLACRAAFGVGALILNGAIAAMLAQSLARALGPGPLASRIDSAGKWLMLAGMSPILIPLLLFLLAASLVGAVREYVKTGRWPRNEEFIARMKLKRC